MRITRKNVSPLTVDIYLNLSRREKLKSRIIIKAKGQAGTIETRPKVCRRRGN